MSDELRLPDDLAAIEARLAAQPLAASRIARDQLMYQAGWAAAEAAGAGGIVGTIQLADSTLPSSPEVIRGGTRTPRLVALCSSASAALAASLAVAVTLALQPTPTAEPIIARSTAPAASAPGPVDAAKSRRDSAPSSQAPADSLVRFAELRRWPANSPLWASRRGAPLSAWNDFEVSTASVDVAASDAPRTARELLDEFVPRAAGPTFPLLQLWLGNDQSSSGDAI
jgi:hypothetical protein